MLLLWIILYPVFVSFISLCKLLLHFFSFVSFSPAHSSRIMGNKLAKSLSLSLSVAVPPSLVPLSCTSQNFLPGVKFIRVGTFLVTSCLLRGISSVDQSPHPGFFHWFPFTFLSPPAEINLLYFPHFSLSSTNPLSLLLQSQVASLNPSEQIYLPCLSFCMKPAQGVPPPCFHDLCPGQDVILFPSEIHQLVMVLFSTPECLALLYTLMISWASSFVGLYSISKA